MLIQAFSNESFYVTIIKIKKDDGIDSSSFFDLDNQIFKDNSNEIYENYQIYFLNYQNEIAPGIIKNISEDDDYKTINHLSHLSDFSGRSSECPIIYKSNFQVIVIHKGRPKDSNNYNLGTLLKESVENFIDENKKIKKNVNIEPLRNREKRILNQLKIFNKDPIPDISVGPISEDDIFHWEGVFIGPRGTPYEGGVFF